MEQIEGQPSHDPKVMSLWEHIDELRGRLVKSLLAVAVIFFVTIGFANDVLKLLQAPLMQALPPNMQTLHFTGPMDVFVANIKVSMLSAILFGSPIWIYQFWRFVEPALYPHERKWVLPFIFFSIVLFFSGVAFCFFVMLPVALKFLISLGLEVGIPIITISDYLSLLIILLLAFGLVFETPLIIILLALMDIVSAEGLARNRKFIIVGILVIAAVLTPPDVISQTMMAVPMYLMFEVAILIIRLVKREKPKEVSHAA